MDVLSVADVLQPYGLLPPDLEFLRPNEHQYTALLMQPSGPIFASSQRIGPAAGALAAAKGQKFLELARVRNAHLAVTPEYYLPWSTLRDAVTAGTTPAADALWVLGSESITQDGLEQFTQDVAGYCLVLHESWENLTQDRSLLDPAVLLFRARKSDLSTQLVALVLFKTYPSRDDTFFEEALLRCGTQIYQFSGAPNRLSAAVIICSDAFAIEPDEVVRRISVVQDALGNDFRYRRISAIAEVHHELANQTQWPMQVAGLDGKSIVQWSSAEPNFNVRTSGGVPTLVVYLDETHSPNKIATMADKLYDLLRKAGGQHQHRISIIRREHGQLQFVQIPALTRFDEANLDQTEFTAIHPFEPQGPGNG
jgi:hypothetical protein